MGGWDREQIEKNANAYEGGSRFTKILGSQGLKQRNRGYYFRLLFKIAQFE